MYRFTRTVTLKNTGNAPKGVEASMKICGFLKENYNIDLKTGVELFGNGNIHWWFDTQSLDSMTELNSKLMQDKNYIGLVQEYSDLWIDGSLKDTIVKMMG